MATGPTLFLIDGSNQMYRAYHAIRGLTRSDGKSTNATYGFITMLRKLLADHQPQYIVASFDLRGYRGQSRAILEALQRYGMILADNGSPWYVSGAPDAGWDDDDLHGLGRIRGRDFEVVDTRLLRSTAVHG